MKFFLLVIELKIQSVVVRTSFRHRTKDTDTTSEKKKLKKKKNLEKTSSSIIKRNLLKNIVNILPLNSCKRRRFLYSAANA